MNKTQNSNLQAAKSAKNDEFFTQLVIQITEYSLMMKKLLMI